VRALLAGKSPAWTVVAHSVAKRTRSFKIRELLAGNGKGPAWTVVAHSVAERTRSFKICERAGVDAGTAIAPKVSATAKISPSGEWPMRRMARMIHVHVEV